MPAEAQALPRIKTKARRRRMRPPTDREIFDLAFLALVLGGIGHGVLLSLGGDPIAGVIGMIGYGVLYPYLLHFYRFHKRLREAGFHLPVTKSHWLLLGALYLFTIMVWVSLP